MQNLFRHWRLWHWLVLALIIRLFKIAQIHCIAKDGIAYIEIAYGWLSGICFHPIRPPLYPWLISLLMKFGIEPELSGGLISVIFGVLTVAMVYIVTRSVFPQNYARIATIFAVFQPYLVRYSAEVLADSVFTFLIIAVIFCGWLRLHNATPNFFIRGIIPTIFVGIGTALAYLTRPEGIFLIIIISCWWIISMKKWTHKFASLICAWGICFILLFPYLYSIYSKTGQWTISPKQNIVFSIDLYEQGLTDELLDINPVEYAIENPAVFLSKIGKGLLALLGKFPDAYHPLLFIYLIIGLFTIFEKSHPTGSIKWEPDQKRFLCYILSFLMLYSVVYAVFHPGRRCLVKWAPLLLFLAAIGYEKIIYWLHKALNLNQKRAGIALLIITILILIPKTLEPIRKTSIMWKEAGFWIKEHSGGNALVMADDCRVAFYAQARNIPWDKDCFSEVDYIVTKEGIPDIKKTYHTQHGLRIYHGSR